MFLVTKLCSAMFLLLLLVAVAAATINIRTATSQSSSLSIHLAFLHYLLLLQLSFVLPSHAILLWRVSSIMLFLICVLLSRCRSVFLSSSLHAFLFRLAYVLLFLSRFLSVSLLALLFSVHISFNCVSLFPADSCLECLPFFFSAICGSPLSVGLLRKHLEGRAPFWYTNYL